MKFTCVSPVTILFVVLCAAATACIAVIPNSSVIFSASSTIQLLSPTFYANLVLHVFGHANWAHFFGNILLFLLLAPAIETRIGSLRLARLCLIVALLTGIINGLFFDTRLLGASGVVAALILLNGAVDAKRGTIPVALLLLAGLYFGKEVHSMLSTDNISQIAHISGGIVGIAYAYSIAHSEDT